MTDTPSSATSNRGFSISIIFPSLLLAITLLSSCSIYTPELSPRPASWAAPEEATGLPNLHRVSPELYRCAQPESAGYSSAAHLGIKTIVNLRPRADIVEGTAPPMAIHIPVKTSAPTYEQARQFFAVIDDPSMTPVLLHCYHGADRTGAFTALYRINRQGWSAEQAIAEMTGGGYHFHTLWKSLILWVRNAPKF